jgi:hypothetical protein
MVEKETSGAPQSNSPTPMATGAAPGGSSLPHATRPTPLIPPSRCYGLRFLVAFIKQSNREHPYNGPSQGR